MIKLLPRKRLFPFLCPPFPPLSSQLGRSLLPTVLRPPASLGTSLPPYPVRSLQGFSLSPALACSWQSIKNISISSIICMKIFLSHFAFPVYDVYLVVLCSVLFCPIGIFNFHVLSLTSFFNAEVIEAFTCVFFRHFYIFTILF